MIKECKQHNEIKAAKIDLTLQRPSAKDLLRHQFIRRARKTAFLQDLIDRYKRWKVERGNQEDSDSDDSNE